MQVWPGEPYPLGATYDGRGTNFSLFSEAADSVKLCLFDAQGHETQVELPEVTGYCWHGYLPEVVPGQLYGFRVYGPNDPEKGDRCNPSKVLLDPYAKAIEGELKWDEAVFSYHFDDPNGPPNNTDDAPFVPKSAVINPFFDWRNDHHPRTTLHETIIYEAHVKGLTIRHPEIPKEIRGTYAGLGHQVMIDYFKNLGITAVELLPVHQFIHDYSLLKKGLRNYWGYNTLSYFAPHNEYCSRGQCCQQVQEFKTMVQSLHDANIEVFLDVVYNHTAEGNHLGPTLCFRGIDNKSYYRLMEDDLRYYRDFTGTGNSLNMRHPHVLQLIMDSLRYWVLEMHVDGFRFDLASTLARELKEVDRLSAFFDIIQQDPVISQVKLIAEPWDIDADGYQVGNFPPQWSEWNGKYRDSIRKYWRGDEQLLGEFANRFAGSSDLYESTGRRPYASVNFITAHDGFVLRDLVSYNEKHNEANQDNNQDGTDDNFSWNNGVEGPTDDPEIIAVRARQIRSLLATLFLSQGMPMLLGGDEIGRTRHGNNNGYCQDNEMSYFDWEHADWELKQFVRDLIYLRREHPVFRRWRWFQGRLIWGDITTDIAWFKPGGDLIGEEDWKDGFAKSLQVYLNGKNMPGLSRKGEKIVSKNFLTLFNAHRKMMVFKLPPASWGEKWKRVFDTVNSAFDEDELIFKAEQEISVEDSSVVVLHHVD